jgi:hypothetical protein
MKRIDDGEARPQKDVAKDPSRRSSNQQTAREPADREMQCPVCGTPMPNLKGGKATLCPTCGFKDSCCY